MAETTCKLYVDVETIYTTTSTLLQSKGGLLYIYIFLFHLGNCNEKWEKSKNVC